MLTITSLLLKCSNHPELDPVCRRFLLRKMKGEKHLTVKGNIKFIKNRSFSDQSIINPDAEKYLT